METTTTASKSLAARAWIWLALAALAAGCTYVPPPEFRLNLQGRDPEDFRITGNERRMLTTELRSAGGQVDSKLLEERLTELVALKQRRTASLQFTADALYAMFGTPDDPYVFPESDLDLTKVRLAAGPTGGDALGQQRGLYRQHCVHCHGITGDGDGPTAPFLIPYPRDYRKGLFKFKSTERAARPTHDDLKRVLLDGVPGTAMPSFALLPDVEVEALVEYVKYLSIRGEVEADILRTLLDDENEIAATRDELVALLEPVVALWQAAEEAVIVPADRPEVTDVEAWLAAGRELFIGPKAQCAKCHGPNGLGDGSEERLYDDWNKDKLDPVKLAELHQQLAATSKTADAAARAMQVDRLYRALRIETTWDLSVQELSPRNLRLGIYRGGRRPVDLYRRIYAGIAGTPMPAGGPPSPGAPPVLTPEEIWQLVDFVRSLPYETFHPAHGASTSHAALDRIGKETH